MDKETFRNKMRDIARTRMVSGNPPECGGDWFTTSPVIDEEGVRWFIHYRYNQGTDWKTVKVFSDGLARRKANFWIGWNGERTNRSKDTGALEQQRPYLYDLVMDRLQEEI